MNETQILLTIGDFTLTAYGVTLTAGMLLAVALTALLGRKNPGVNASLSLCLTVMPCALLGARLVYCLTMLEGILVDMGGAGFLPQLWQGGYTLYGAILGGGLGVYLYAKCTKRPVAVLMDLAAPGAAWTLMAARLGEYFTSQGLGDYVENEALWRFPFAVESVYGDWQMPVFLYEAVAALVIFAVVLPAKKNPAGRYAERFVILLGLSQILLESWREDEFIRFGFVRFTQIAAVVTVAVVVGVRIARCVKAGGWTIWSILRIVLFLLGVGLCIGVEFALDKSSIDNTLLYVVMAVMLCVMGICSLPDGKINRNACARGKEMVQ